MAIFKCKMCGGDLNITEEVKIVECDYCGTNQTVATADNEKKVNLFNRANRLRMSNEFDKAAGIYESIVAEFSEEPEAYWGLVLCKYGIEYVDDPLTAKKIPTCHRSSFESIMDDSDFEQVMECSDSAARKVYREEAKAIEEIRKGIIEVSSNEKPYDIFICYKETAEDGERTIDSVIAQDIYDELTTKGYKVFFSRISLEDKLGVEYEPYIFAALNSAKIMLVFGTDYEYFNAVWVKNEWSRFLKLMAGDKTKHLIPCYKGVDAYDMPKEFAKLQAQDMGKVGATQDLLRGIEKILPQNGAPAVQAAPAAQPVATSNPSVESYLKRVFVFLEDGDFKSADEYCEKVLDFDVENAQAYLGKLMAELKVRKQDDLKNLKLPFDSSNNYKKIKQYGDNSLIAMVDSNLNCINNHFSEIKKAISEKQNRLHLISNLISAGYEHSVCLKTDGTVVATGENYYGQRNVGTWSNIVAVSAGNRHTVGLKADGTVVAIGTISDDRCDVGSWRDIFAVSARFSHTVGLKADGTVVATGTKDNIDHKIYNWKNISAVSTGYNYTVGLKTDGTVVATGNKEQGQCNTNDWTDIVAISAGLMHTVGLKADGSVVVTGGNKFGQCNVSNWKDIVAISAGRYHTVGIMSNGTVVTAGDNTYGQCNTNGWTDIVAISAGLKHTIGVKSDGTVVTAGENYCGQCDVKGLRLFESLSTIPRERSEKMEKAIAEKQRRLNAGLCLHCGGAFKGLITKKCSNCGKEKDY